MLATFLIGLREGLEAALVVGILAAYLSRVGRRDVLPRLWIGVGLAIALAVGVGAVLTFGEYAMTFQGQEILGGTLSLVAVAMVTWMVFWMQKTSRHLKRALEGQLDRALQAGTIWALILVGFVSVAREGVESALLLWSMTSSFGSSPTVLLGALLGFVVAAVAGWALARGMLRLNLRVFFAWTGGFLVIVAAGVLAYALHDLQEAGVIPGPFTALAPVTATGAVAVGWAGFPFGWAFDVSHAIAPGGAVAVVLQALVGFMPQMSWIQVIAWVLYVAIVGTFFLRGLHAPVRTAGAAASAAPAASAPAASTPAASTPAAPAPSTVSATAPSHEGVR
ncbi:iron uptake transporter permease EfeU [Microbacterium sp.]|uniref:iron uptake transporter permease EfeU n=1 Tax=Microbacterium sp. TaxID=51671 RepID=UPI003A9175A6